MLRISARDIEALLEAMVAWEKIKPGQVGKRRVFKRYGLLGTSKDRVFTAIIYGVSRRRGLVDRIISSTGCSIEELDLYSLMLLRAIVYEKYFGEGETNVYLSLVKLGPNVIGRIVGKGAKEKIATLIEKVINVSYKPKDRIEELEFKYNAPYWFIHKLVEMIEWDETISFLEVTNRPPPLSFRINTLKASVEEVLEEFRKEGYRPIIGRYVSTVVKIREPYDYSSSKLLKNGKIIPQDEASALASILLGVRPGMVVVDLCAAPGGKTTHIAEIMKNHGRIIAIELYEDRAARLRQLLKRAGISIAEVHVMDAREAVKLFGEEIADRVLLDPSCSSTGAIAKHPEAKWRLNESVLSKLVSLQRELLDIAVRLLKPGGRLLYTTCSVLREENEENIEWILHKYKDIVKLIPLKEPFSPGFLPGTMRAWPHRHEVTGFFYALMEKIK